MNRLMRSLLRRMPRLTVLRSAERTMENARLNQPYVRSTIADLTDDRMGEGNSVAIVIGAGPSLHRRQPIPLIRDSGFDGPIVATDGALGVCLRQGLVPHYVLCLDPHPTRVCRWFGDPELLSRSEEDNAYFRRQEMDPYLGTDALRRNREQLELINHHGPMIKAALCTSVAPAVRNRCLQAGMTLYWWNPLMDDVDEPASRTRSLYQWNKAPCLLTGGNVGTAAWVFAHQVLGAREVALVGMDLGYAPDMSVENTQYYAELKHLFGSRFREALIHVKNPYLGETWFADPAYYWYRQCFLRLAAQATCITYNCTEGGTLFGKGIRWMSLKEFLSMRCAAAVHEG